MRRKVVHSSVIRSVGYHRRAGVLELEFVNGHLYQYLPVPHEVYEELMAADSIGAFVNKRIKPHFKCIEIRKHAAA